ncbi:AaceriADR245Wp [[Ashbya] aceris (nom. inval.)]|nr:AaceriADR245Wp [[Ashbya] aceris (nom. inval.)]
MPGILIPSALRISSRGLIISSKRPKGRELRRALTSSAFGCCPFCSAVHILKSAPKFGGVPLFNLVNQPIVSAVVGMKPNESRKSVIVKRSGNLPLATDSRIFLRASRLRPCDSALATNSARLLRSDSLRGPPTRFETKCSKLLISCTPISAPPTAVWKRRITLAMLSPTSGMFSTRLARSVKLGRDGAAGFSSSDCSSPSRFARNEFNISRFSCSGASAYFWMAGEANFCAWKSAGRAVKNPIYLKKSSGLILIE